MTRNLLIGLLSILNITQIIGLTSYSFYSSTNKCFLSSSYKIYSN